MLCSPSSPLSGRTYKSLCGLYFVCVRWSLMSLVLCVCVAVVVLGVAAAIFALIKRNQYLIQVHSIDKRTSSFVWYLFICLFPTAMDCIIFMFLYFVWLFQQQQQKRFIIFSPQKEFERSGMYVLSRSTCKKSISCFMYPLLYTDWVLGWTWVRFKQIGYKKGRATAVIWVVWVPWHRFKLFYCLYIIRYIYLGQHAKKYKFFSTGVELECGSNKVETILLSHYCRRLFTRRLIRWDAGTGRKKPGDRMIVKEFNNHNKFKYKHKPKLVFLTLSYCLWEIGST